MAAERRTWEIRAAGNDALLDRVEAGSELEALVAYARGLPAEVTVEARADGSLLGRLARYVVYACSRPATDDDVHADRVRTLGSADERRQIALAEMLARQTRGRRRW